MPEVTEEQRSMAKLMLRMQRGAEIFAGMTEAEQRRACVFTQDLLKQIDKQDDLIFLLRLANWAFFFIALGLGIALVLR